MSESLWRDTAQMPCFPSLDHDAVTDVLIVGGGMAGILCAYFLARAGVHYLLCEADTVGSGTTGGTTAVLSAQHDLIYSRLLQSGGRERARAYLKANLEALADYRRLCRHIDCDFEEKPSYLYTTGDIRPLKEEARALQRLGFHAPLVNDLPLPVSVTAAVRFPDQAQFHPLKFLSAICRGLNICEHTRIDHIESESAYSGPYHLAARQIIVTSHFPILNTRGLFPVKLHQQRSYVIALENAAQYDGTFVDCGKGGLYFRNYRELLLVGGGDHRTGYPGGQYDVLRQFIRTQYPRAREKYAWSTQDCMSLDQVPYIGRYSERLPHVFVASGFNEWGMTSSMAAAQLLTDLVTGQSNDYRTLFDPSRHMPAGPLLQSIGAATAGLLTPSRRRCPHLGCALKWNAAEHSWDCPCHGSRFDEEGTLLNNPATGDGHV